MISREYEDDTLKNLLTIPLSFPRLMTGKLTTLGILALLLGLYDALITLLIGLVCCKENLTLSAVLSGGLQMTAMALFTCIGELPLIAVCGRKRGAFRGGALAAFLLGYFAIFLKSPVLRDLYPLSAGLSIIQFRGDGFVSDTTGSYGSTQNSFTGIGVMLAMIILTALIIHIPGNEIIAAAYTKKNSHGRHGRTKYKK
jgi:ABC-2 type transport system permease protein/bacitracin transport system permease protein